MSAATTSTRSRLMTGRVYHERLTPKRHAFGYPSAWCYLDLDEVASGQLESGRLFSAERAAVLRFRRSDYIGGSHTTPSDDRAAALDLKSVVLDRVETKLGRRPPAGARVRLLTQVRNLGYVFNPVSFYFVFQGEAEDDEQLVAIVAEITNTPWGQRYDYVFDARRSAPGELVEFDFAKRFHVSPFFDMHQLLRWRFRVPSAGRDELEVHMTNVEEGREVFHAGMTLRARPLTAKTLRRAAWTFPLPTLGVHLAIYVHAGLLWLKRVPFFTHPDKRSPADAPEPTQPEASSPGLGQLPHGDPHLTTTKTHEPR
ncbi:MAG: DUF1365 domain-containing protein [Planctomycetota bacterium]|nr:DUF1365 domain-containing protein [Planctomycetota bacterium]